MSAPESAWWESPIGDDDRITVENAAGRWSVSWHAPDQPPPGTPHGANAWCVTPEGTVILISEDGIRFGWPGGRPEGSETWEETLRREIDEECCCTVTSASLIGFVRAECISGVEAGSVLVRSIWRASVDVNDWLPEHEVVARKVVPQADLETHLWMEEGFEPVYARAILEAAL